MNTWDERRDAIVQSCDFDPLSTIPMIEIGPEFSETMETMKTRIRTEFDRHTAMNIVVMDPYFEPQQMELVVELFASLKGRSIQVITNLDSVEGRENKEELARKLAKVKRTVLNKGLFDAASIWKTEIGIHDRILFCPDEGCSALFFCFGASLNMVFKKHSYILRVTNTSFKYTIVNLANKCKSNGYEVQE